MSKKLKQKLDRIEAKLDLLLQNSGVDLKSLDSIPGGGIKPPKKEDEDDDDGNG